MKAISFNAKESISVIDVDAPESPGVGQAKVKVHRVGICGTDTSAYLGKFPFFQFPRTPGHELGVEVMEVGEGVSNVKVGDRCSVEPYMNDPESYSSKRGRPNCCDNLQVIGVHCDGGMCEEFLLPAHKLHVGNGLKFDQLALVETLAIGCHAVNRADPAKGENVLVIGCGPIGLTVVEFLKIRGCRTIMMDMNQDRLDFAKNEMGGDATVQVQKDGSELEQLAELTDGNFCEAVIDATGNQFSMSRALEFVAFAGKLVYVGVTADNVSFPHPLMHRREMTIMGSRNAHAQDFTQIIDLMKEGKIDTDTWITHRTDMDNLSADFPSFLDPASKVLKAMVHITA